MEDIILQGFSWVSYKDREHLSKWRELNKHVEDISHYFTKVWLPPSAYSKDLMGYWPYQLSNQNSCWGSEEELKRLIDNFHMHDVEVIGDIILTHRAQFNVDKSFDEEINNQIFTFKHNDWSENFIEHPDGGKCRMLAFTDNTKNIYKRYLKYLHDEIGYDGFRIDIAKALSDIAWAKDVLSDYEYVIHEYYDTNVDKLKNYISNFPDTHKIFNFRWKYNVCNDGLAKGSYTTLLAENNVEQDFANRNINFVENHDTQDCFAAYVEKSDADKIILANAVMLTSPITPCVFWRDWVEKKDTIKHLIDIRKAYKIGNGINKRIAWLNTAKTIYTVQYENQMDGSSMFFFSWNMEDLFKIDSIKENIKTFASQRGLNINLEGKYFLICGTKHIDTTENDGVNHKELKLKSHDIEIEFHNDENWENVYFFEIKPNEDEEKSKKRWPGIKMEKENGVYKKVLKNRKFVEYVINNGNAGYPRQTADLYKE